MKILVTGSGGQLGSELCRQLGDAAIGLDLPELDLTDAEAVRRRLDALRPRTVVNAAAYTQVDRAEDEPERCWAVNARGVAHLAEACRRLDCPLLQASTDYVFGGQSSRTTPYRETDPPSPQGVYARSKWAGEQEAAAWAKHWIVRTAGLYGPPGPRSAGNFVHTLLQLGAAGGRVRVVADQHCTPSYVAHVARAIRFLLSTQAYGAYHVVNTGQTTWHEFAAEIFRGREKGTGAFCRQRPRPTLRVGARCFAQKAPVPFSHLEAITTAQYAARAPRPAYSVLDTSRYHALPGAPAMPPWQEALREYLSAAPSISPGGAGG